ncbi:hypothetical protein N7468_006545 [Penicillium chermesinum]|uniref:Uncharacterized protein n=1 Tax=Penicillium chermesinum TaxID=63820 RepID=A0A9W9TL94_9EURO|nr:uncharacterized protein N7468_006545 [Penicillium chermesinum]KAJ5225320.1 hypothetical protein N7468_006545 [Penicillium chermesinum]
MGRNVRSLKLEVAKSVCFAAENVLVARARPITSGPVPTSGSKHCEELVVYFWFIGPGGGMRLMEKVDSN